jgi:hypothetical protein
VSHIACDEIRGEVFRPLFGRPLDPDELERLILTLPGPPAQQLGRRWDEEEHVLSMDFTRGGVPYTAGLYQGEPTFVSIRFDAAQAPAGGDRLTAGDAIGCLGAPSQVQAWYDYYPHLSMASLHAALVFIGQRMTVFASLFYSPAPEQPPALDDTLPVTLIGIYGEQWAEDRRVLAKSDPWPGAWEAVHVETIRHEEVFPLDENEDE